MEVTIGDLDIDVVDRSLVLHQIRHTAAAIHTEGKIKKHNTGIYVQDVPIDQKTGFADFDHKNNDYFKIDFLNFSVLGNFISNKQLETLVHIEPNWDLLRDKEFVEGTTHIHRWYDLLQKMPVTSVDELAMFLAVIRPAAEHLRYKKWEDIEKVVWDDKSQKYSFKKSHAYGYALTIVALMNLRSGL